MGLDNTLYGYAGKISRVDLSRLSLEEQNINEEMARKYVGGRGFGAKILFEEMSVGLDPFDPESLLIFATGPLTGTVIPGGTRYMVIGKSPLTGCYGESNAGGSFGPALKRAGYDCVVVTGKSEKPVYLYISNGGVEIRDASHLWGCTVGEAEDAIKAELDDRRVVVAAIGPGGERLARIAAIISEKARAAARTGLGALMGSKKLKAIAVLGENQVVVAQEDEVGEIARRLNRRFSHDPGKVNLREYGTAAGVAGLQVMGMLPTRNYREGVFEGYESISGERMTETILKTKDGCPGCAIRCWRRVEVKSGPFAPCLPEYGGPEYETIGALGSLCLNSNLESIARAHNLCNMYGIDTISTGVVIAWAMECFEKGILTVRELDGLELNWGNAEAIVAMVEKMGKREGIGKLLSEGVRRASRTVGRGSEEFALHVKGLEPAALDPRGRKGLGLTYATSPRGAVHLDALTGVIFEKRNVAPELGITEPVSRFSVDKKPELIKKSEEVNTFVSAAGGCEFALHPFMSPVTLTELAQIVSAVTGWNLSVEELMTVGERANNLARVLNVREGLTRDDDVLPLRFSEPLPEGASEGQAISAQDLQSMLDQYYRLRGWDEKGIPLKSTLKRLGLDEVIVDLEGCGLM